MEILHEIYEKLIKTKQEGLIPVSWRNSNLLSTFESIEDEHYKEIHSYIFKDLERNQDKGLFSPSFFEAFLIKPISDACNLGCSYCYEASSNFEANTARMKSSELPKLVDEIFNNSGELATFLWHGGEPLLVGLEFYEKAVELQKAHPSKKKFLNVIQTNGVLLNQKWFTFFKANNFFISLSFDGPQDVHDKRRFYRSGKGSYTKVTEAFQKLNEDKIPFHVITVANNELLGRGEDYYDEIKKWDIKSFDIHPNFQNLSSYMSPVQFFKIFSEVYDIWKQENSNRIFVPVKDFFSAVIKGAPETCYHAGTCTEILAIDGDGELLSCTRPFDKKKYTFGNIQKENPIEVASTEKKFIQFKEKDQSAIRRSKEINCKWAEICNNGCPQHRHTNNQENVAGNSVYCTCHTDKNGGYYEIWNKIYSDLLYVANFPQGVATTNNKLSKN